MTKTATVSNAWLLHLLSRLCIRAVLTRSTMAISMLLNNRPKEFNRLFNNIEMAIVERVKTARVQSRESR